MLAIRSKSEIEERLARLAERTGRTKAFYAREAILEHLDDLEDGYFALQRIDNPGHIFTAAEVKRALATIG